MSDQHIDAIKAATLTHVIKKITIQEELEAAKGSPDYTTIERRKQAELVRARHEWKNAVSVARARLHGRSV